MPHAYLAVVVPVLFGAVGLLTLFLILFLVAFRSAKRLSSPWLRRFVQFGTILGVALSVMLLGGLVWATYPSTVRGPMVYSPDGKHAALVTWDVGPLVVSDDIATVKVRHRSGIFAAEVFSGPGYSNDPDELQVRWIDNDHLLIRYDKWFGYDYSHACTSHAFGVEVTCEPRP